MSLAPGDRLGAYAIVGPLGAGGMGEVYRARDTRLKREVAIKVLPEAFAADPDRVARFQREAELLATLNHPNIAAVYGLEDGPATGPAEAGHYVRALVLELVEGPTLADRIAQGPMALDDALPIARQIAEALEAAHDKGVIHRDLKPANIKVTPEGTVKVLDFGLAKLLDSERPASSVSMSPTLSVHATYAGVILGTAAYMSPEQARGKPVDRRTDIWAFGCVLYEMLAGRRVFDGGETVSDAVAAILTREPDWTALPAHVPARIRTLLRRCLQKDPQKRLHHIADARLELDDAAGESAEASSPASPQARTLPGWRRALPWAMTALALGLATWTLRSRADGGAAADPRPVVRLELNLPTGVELFTSSTRTVALSPDGTRLAFVGVLGGSRQVYLRDLNRLDAIPVRGSENATTCFFSPDGRSIGLSTAAGVLRTISLGDGLVTTASTDASFLYGSAWTPDDRIVFVRGGALWQVPRAGGAAQALTTLGGPRQDTLHAWPVVLPDGKALVFGVASGEEWRIDSLVLATGERRTIVERATLPFYSASGHLAFFREGRLLAAPFDAGLLQVTGPAVQVVDDLPTTVADVSSSGTVVYSPTSAVSRLVWVSRQGVEQPLNDALRNYAMPRIAPDGSRVAVQAGDLWIQDLARATFTRLASRDVVTNGFPIWTPDGRRVVYRSPNGLSVQDVDGGAQTRVIPSTSEFDYPASVSTDGDTLVFMRSSEETSFDIYAASLSNLANIRPILSTDAYEGGARLSPDGRLLIYVSNESGQNEVYMRPFSGPERRWQVSSEGGTQPVWGSEGREIFYRNGNTMMVVGVTTTPDVALSPARLLFERQYAYAAGITIPNYDVTRDGQRFVMVKNESTAGRLNVVLNWFSDPARLASAGR